MTTPQGPGTGPYASPVEYVKPAPPMAQPGAWPAPPPVQQIHCRFCGATPGRVATVHAHRGMVFVMQFRTLKGPYCRDCGIATVRDMSSQTLWQGWWGPASFFITPVILLINVVRRIQFGRMPSPTPYPGGPAPMSVGRPLFLRFGIVGVLVPLLVVLAVVASANDPATSTNEPSTTVPLPAPALVGRCVTIDEANDEIKGNIVGCSTAHQGRIVAEVGTEKDCPDETEWYFDKTNGLGVICVAKD
jgi:hypothetical protein